MRRRFRGTALAGLLALLTAAMVGCGSGYSATIRPTTADYRRNMEVPAGQGVPVRASRRLTTHQRYRIAEYSLVLNADLLTEAGQVAAPAGTPVEAWMVSDSPNGFGTPGSLRIDLYGVHTRGGFVPLSGRMRVQGERKHGSALALGLGLMLLIGPFAWLFFAKQGGHAVIEEGTILMGMTR